MKVMIFEKSSKLLAKVRISGGGRCNVTHDCESISEMLKKYPRGSRFLKKAFPHFFTLDTIKWFDERGVKLKTESDGRMFPVSDNSQSIIDCLLREAGKYKVDIKMNADIIEIRRYEDDSFKLTTRDGAVHSAGKLCVACGGFPKASQFEWLSSLGHSFETPVPSLFTFNIPGNSITNLMGVTVENTSVKIAGSKLQQSGPLLITHWGMSGPAILKLSAWGARELAEKNYHFKSLVNWVPIYHENSAREFMQQFRFSAASQKVVNRNPFALPSRLWEHLIAEAGISPDVRWADLPAKEQNNLARILTSHEFEVKGKTTFKEEFVTAGGINLDEIDPQTMQSRKVKNLFFAGEIINVDGVTGGFNFQNAWTTGYLAAVNAAK